MWHQQRYALHAIDITQSIAPASNDSFAWETKPGVGWMSTIVIHSFTRSFSCCHSFIMSCCSCGPGDCFVDTRNCFSRRCDTRESERVQFHVPLHLISACVLRIFACFLCFFSVLVRYILSPVRLSVCLSVVCNVRAPYSGDWNFRQCFYAVWYLGHLRHFDKNFTEIVTGKPLCRGVKPKRGSQI